MFKERIPSVETEYNTTRPLVFASLRKMLEYFGNDFKNHKVLYNGNNDISDLIGSFSTDRELGDRETDTGYNERLYVEVDYDDSEYNSAFDESNQNPTTPLIWYEPLTGSGIRAIYRNKMVNVTVNKYFPDRSEAMRFRERMNIWLRHRTLQVFSCNTHFPVSTNMLYLYKTIYDRLVNAGSIDKVDNWLDWFTSNSKLPIRYISNRVGNNTLMVFCMNIKDKTLRMGQGGVKEVVGGAYRGQYIASFSYSFEYAEHVNYELTYPIMVYQQPTDPIWIPAPYQEETELQVYNTFLENKLAHFTRPRYSSEAQNLYVDPPHDNWRPPYTGYLSALSITTQYLEDKENQLVDNLFNNEYLIWDPRTKEYLLKYHSKLNKRHKNPFFVALYSNDILVSPEDYTIDERGDIYLIRKPNMRNIHRIVLYIDYALGLYDEDCISDLENNPDDAKWIICKMFPYLRICPYCKDDDFIWEDVIDVIDIPGTGNNSIRFPNWMISSSIVVHNRETQYDPVERYKRWNLRKGKNKNGKTKDWRGGSACSGTKDL